MVDLHKPPAIRDLRHRVTFQSLTLMSDGQGGKEESWADFATVWAAHGIIFGKSEETFAEALRSTDDRVVWIRWLSGVNPTMRVLFSGKVWQIKAVDMPNDQRFWMRVLVQEAVGT